MVPLEVYFLLAVCDSAVGAMAGQLLPCLYRCAFGVDWELHHADGRAEAVAMGALEYAEHTPQRESPGDLYYTKTDHLQPFLAGIFAGTLFWVGVRWITTVLPGKLAPNVINTHPNMSRNDTKVILHEHCFCSVLRTYGLFLFLHHVLRPRLCAQISESQCLQGHH